MPTLPLPVNSPDHPPGRATRFPMASQETTTVDPSGSKRSRVLEAILDPQYDHISNRQLARLIMVDEWMLRKYRKQLGKGSKFQRGRPPRDLLAAVAGKEAKPDVAKPKPATAVKPKPVKVTKPKRKPAVKKPVAKGKGKAKAKRK